MPTSLDGLTLTQREAVTHRGGPLLVLGGPGTGKTRVLVARFAWLVEQGVAPEAILLLGASRTAAELLREHVEDGLQRSYEQLEIGTVGELCARLVHDEALEAGLDPFAVHVTAAERLAMLMEHVDELTLSRHDFRGDPAALLGSFVARIDRLKDGLVSAERYARWAAELDPADPRRERECEFAAVYAEHERMLADAGALDSGDLVLHAVKLLGERADVRARVAASHPHVLVDDVGDLGAAERTLVELLAGDGVAHLFAAAASERGTEGLAGADGVVSTTHVVLASSHRCPEPVLRAAAAVSPGISGTATAAGAPDGEVLFWRCLSERAQAQAVAADIERLIHREGVAAAGIAVLVRSVRREGQAVAVALEERGVAHRIVGASAFFLRPEVRDLLAWLRLLADPGDAGAVVRALARPPIELRSIDLARCTQIARRRKLDMVAALAAATESPQIPPEARERILSFLKLYRSAAAALDTMRPDLYVHRLIERLGLRRQQLFAAQVDVVERLVNLARFGELATAYVRRSPQGTPREFARHIAAVAESGLPDLDGDDAGAGGAGGSADAPAGAAVRVMAMRAVRGLEWEHVYVVGLHAERMPGAPRRELAPIPPELAPGHPPAAMEPTRAHRDAMRQRLARAMTCCRARLVLAYPAASDRGAAQLPSPFVEEARGALDAEWEERAEELFGPAESLPSTYRILRDELLETIARTGGRLGELRFDTNLDVSHAVVRYLELLKLAALIARPPGQGVAEALPEINARLAQAVTAEQREILTTSPLDEYLLDAERDERRRAAAVAAREEPSLEAFLPRRGEGLALSASDIDTYRACPLRYKFARVFRIPQEPTLNQRFGILIHQVLERFHAGEQRGGGMPELLGLLDAGWRRGGFSDSEQERQLRGKATDALRRYHARFLDEQGEPMWFERSFAFHLGPHLLRGRVDRVDRLPEGGYELIDYKTGRPKTATQLRDDVQLSLYAVGAREAWSLESAQQSYYYVLDDEKVPVPHAAEDRTGIEDTVLEVADGILAQGFEPTPSYAVCSSCDYRIVCPAAER